MSDSENKYSTLTDIDINNVEDFQTTSIEWAMKTRLIRANGSTDVYILNEDDTQTLIENMYNMHPQWND